MSVLMGVVRAWPPFRLGLSLLALAFWGGGIPLWAQNAPRWTFYVQQDTYADYVDYTEGYAPFEAPEVKSEGLWRHLMETLVFQHALLLSDCNCAVDIRPLSESTTRVRIEEEVKSGRMLASPVASFERDSYIGTDLYLSTPVLAADEFFVGLFTHAGRSDILSLTDPEAVRGLQFGVGETWEIDQQILARRGFNAVLVDDYKSILAMLRAGRLDVFMQPFASGDDLSFTDPLSKQTFKPIPGIRMPFPAARRYIVSKTHPEGREFLAYLDQGLALLRENGKLTEYLIASGVLHPSTFQFLEL